MIEPKLAELARLAAGLTQTGLASALGVTQPFISQIESGDRPIPEDLIERWAVACDVAPAFLRRPEPPPTPAVSGMVHRRMRTLPAKPFNKAVSRARMRCMELDGLFADVEVEPALELPTFSEGVGPDDAAAALRRIWRLPDGPLPDLTALVEAAGVPVLLLDDLHDKHSAISQRGRWVDWLIAMNGEHAASRRRFSLAHEIGHVVLGHDKRVVGDDEGLKHLEHEADLFASALLLPADDARRELGALNLRRLVTLKNRWKVSIVFLIKRATTLDLITTNAATSLYIQLGSLPGGRRREPGEFQEERPRLIETVVKALIDEGLSLADIAATMTITEERLRVGYLGERPSLRTLPDGRRTERRVVSLRRPGA